MKKNVSISAGYTFIELLVVISIIGIISVVGIASFVTFNNNQIIDAAASDVANSYTIARQRTISQIKPSQCTATQVLRGYEVNIGIAARTYQVRAVCGAARYVISHKTLPQQLSFANTTPFTVFFEVPNATINAPATVTINGFGKSKRVEIQPTGSISIL